MKNTCIQSCLWMLLLVAPMAFAQQGPLAFPGAEGFGRFAQGGRGGRVIEVTNLKDSGPGSFRAAVEASGPRTVVFRVGGTIALDKNKKPPRISDPFITIAGQTAPGDGITIKGGMLDIRASHVIVRYVRIRPGPNVFNPESGDAIQVFSFLNDVHDVIIDHVSMSWTTDEMFSVWAEPYAVKNVTIQWSILSEALNCATHPEGCHSTGLLVGGEGEGADVSIHHNLLAHHNYRFPVVSHGNVDLVNNVMYNYGIESTTLEPYQGPVKINIVRNNYIPGPNSTSVPPVRLLGNDKGDQPFAPSSGVFLEGNVHPVYASTGTEDQGKLLKIHTPGFPSAKQSRFNYPSVATTDASQAKNDVLANAGATLPMRDSVDTRVVKDVTQGTGRLVDTPSQAGGYLAVSAGTPPPDDDHDGMPDTWESAHGLNPKNSADGPQDTDNDGYTNLEEYLNGTALMNDVVPPTPPKDLKVVEQTLIIP